MRASSANCYHASQPTIARWLSQEQVEIIRRCDQTTRFVVLPKSWVVQRALARLNRCRRLGKDWENPNRKAGAFLLTVSICFMLRKIGRP